MRRLLVLAFLVPLAAGCGWADVLFGGHVTSSPVPARTLVVAYVWHAVQPAFWKTSAPMPPFGSLGRARLHQLAIFLEASEGLH